MRAAPFFVPGRYGICNLLQKKDIQGPDVRLQDIRWYVF